MSNAKVINRPVREIFLMIADLDEHRNPFSVALLMCNALKNGEINDEQFQWFSNELKRDCKLYNISTENEICSLF